VFTPELTLGARHPDTRGSPAVVLRDGCCAKCARVAVMRCDTLPRIAARPRALAGKPPVAPVGRMPRPALGSRMATPLRGEAMAPGGLCTRLRFVLVSGASGFD